MWKSAGMLATGAIWAATGLCNAEVVFSTYTDPPEPDTGVFYRIDAQSDQRLGWRFTPSASGNVSNVLASIFQQGAPLRPVTFEIYHDNGELPGSLLGTLSGTPAPISLFVQTEYTPSSAIPITAGELYYLVFARPSAGVFNWSARSLGTPGITQVGQSNEGAWSSASLVPALFSVSIPAPGAGGVLSALVLLTRRRRR